MLLQIEVLKVKFSRSRGINLAPLFLDSRLDFTEHFR
jgi:hypothetical protein